jgi:hypothetical protein
MRVPPRPRVSSRRPSFSISRCFGNHSPAIAPDTASSYDNLRAVDVPTDTVESARLAGMLALSHSLVAVADSRRADAEATVEHTTELARYTGEGTAFGLGFGPTNVGLWRMEALLEAGDYESVTTLAGDLNPEMHPLPVAPVLLLDK